MTACAVRASSLSISRALSKSPPSRATKSSDQMPSEMKRASPSTSAVAGCLQSIFTELQPDLERFVRNCIGAHIQERKNETSRYGFFTTDSIYARVTVILNTSTRSKQRDFAAYLSFMLSHWGKYFERICGSYCELRGMVQSVLRLRNDIAHQIDITGAEFDIATDHLTRFAVFICAHRMTRFRVRECVNATERAATEAKSLQSQLQHADSIKFLLPPQLAKVLCLKLGIFVRSAVADRLICADPDNFTERKWSQLETEASGFMSSKFSSSPWCFGEYLRYIDKRWDTDFKLVQTYPEIHDIAKQVLQYYDDYIVPQVTMNAKEFNDAVDAISRLFFFYKVRYI